MILVYKNPVSFFIRKSLTSYYIYTLHSLHSEIVHMELEDEKPLEEKPLENKKTGKVPFY